MNASQATDPRFPRPTPGEAERLAELQRYSLLDTPPDEAFDDLVAIAAAACDAPMAAVTLIDAERQWMKAAHGMPPVECPRPDSFCAHALLVPDEVMVVADAARDPRCACSIGCRARSRPSGSARCAGWPSRRWPRSNSGAPTPSCATMPPNARGTSSRWSRSGGRWPSRTHASPRPA